MKRTSALAKTGLFCLMIALAACSKKSSPPSNSGTDTDASDGYITCPSTGYYTNSSGYSTNCTPGNVVYVGTSSNGYVTCPSNGVYTSNGMSYNCTPGQSIYTGNGNGNGNDGCSQWTQQYGVVYVPVRYQGSMVCMRQDLARQYGQN